MLFLFLNWSAKGNCEARSRWVYTRVNEPFCLFLGRFTIRDQLSVCYSIHSFSFQTRFYPNEGTNKPQMVYTNRQWNVPSISQTPSPSTHTVAFYTTVGFQEYLKIFQNTLLHGRSNLSFFSIRIKIPRTFILRYQWLTSLREGSSRVTKRARNRCKTRCKKRNWRRSIRTRVILSTWGHESFGCPRRNRNADDAVACSATFLPPWDVWQMEKSGLRITALAQRR